jgi:hypothetical protein
MVFETINNVWSCAPHLAAVCSTLLLQGRKEKCQAHLGWNLSAKARGKIYSNQIKEYSV